jgi:hypothetical protein
MKMTMIEMKQAVQLAKQTAAEVLGEISPRLEEIERDLYNSREVWSITLSLPFDEQTSAIARIADPFRRHYKRFLIDAETGELLAIKLRETVAG